MKTRKTHPLTMSVEYSVVYDFLASLGFDPHDVESFKGTATGKHQGHLMVTYHKRNQDGHKYIIGSAGDPDDSLYDEVKPKELPKNVGEIARGECLLIITHEGDQQ